jgi:hypothetical protein
MVSYPDYITCDLNSLTKVEVLKLLLDHPSNCDHFVNTWRTVDVTADEGCESPIECTRDYEFWPMFLRCIALAPDGKPALRVIVTNYSQGARLTGLTCGDDLTFEDLLKTTFVITHGYWAVNIANIT